MIAEHIIDEKIIMYKSDIKIVYLNSILWINKMNAKILEKKEPTYIKAIHQGPRGYYYEDYKKEITILLEQNINSVMIRIIMDEHEKNPFLDGYANRRRAWSSLVEDYWTSIGMRMDDDLFRRLYPSDSLTKNINDHQKRIIVFFSFLILVVIWAYFNPKVIFESFIGICIVSLLIIIEWSRINKWKQLQNKPSEG